MEYGSPYKTRRGCPPWGVDRIRFGFVVWAAEQQVDERLAAELIREQFPDLPCRSVTLVSEGWDYIVHRVDGEWAFRFPRRAVVVPNTEREIAVLPRLAPLLSVPVPTPVHIGRPGPRFPWLFYGAAFVPGAEPDAGLSDAARRRIARPLARTLRVLHAPGTLALGEELPFDPIGRADMAARVPRARRALVELARLGLWRPPPTLDELLARALALPAPEPIAVCHGDLHFRQLLVDGGRLSGLVDWVDLCRSDPGVDLAIAWSFFRRDAREEFLAEYGTTSEASLLRGRVVALSLSASLALYAHAERLAGIEAEALASLDRALDG